jgi:hypothetical protein
MPAYANECLFSTVQNTSGETMVFGFLPPHGTTLAANEDYTVFGDILEAINRANFGAERRNVEAFLRALDDGRMTLIQTPSPVLLDTVSGASKILQSASGTITGVAVTWPSAEGERQASDSMPA